MHRSLYSSPPNPPKSLKGEIPFIVFFALVVLSFLPFMINGENSFITIHDNLDSEFVWRVILSRDHFMMNGAGVEVVPQIMGGIPRDAMLSDLNFIMLLFKVFSPFPAYMINFLIIRLLAFIGMHLLIRTHLLGNLNRNQNINLINLGVSLTFSVLPFYPLYGLSVAGLPLLFYAFLNITRRNGKTAHYMIMLLFPFYSFLFLDGILLIIALLGISLFLLIYEKRDIRHALLAWGLFSIASLVAEYRSIYIFLFDKNFVSHRADWNLDYLSLPFKEVIAQIASIFVNGQYHASSYQAMIFLICGIAILISYRDIRKEKQFILLLLLQFVISIFYGIYMWDLLIPLKSLFGVFSTFNFGRIHWLSPFIWYCLFFLSLVYLYKNNRISRFGKGVIIPSLIFIQLAINLIHNPEYANYVPHGLQIHQVDSEKITYRQFFSENLFTRIGESIALPQHSYHVVCIGIHPSIAQYNGFYTLDGYQNNYPLTYKYQFRKIIAPELDKSSVWQAYYDDWGSRVYMFSSEIPDFLSTKEKHRQITHLDIDTQALKNLGGQYIFSAAEILNYKELKLTLVGVFEDKDSVWRIFVYKVSD